MVHLIRLELKKVHFKKYTLFSVLAILLSMFFVFVALNDTSDSTYTFENTFRAVEMIFAFVFIIFFAVLNVSLIISEYNSKTILLMFTYPVDRKKIIIAKLLMITLFIVVSMIVGYALCCSFIMGIDRYSNLVVGEFSPSVFKNWVTAGASTIIVFCCLGLWTFVAGMLKKSATVTIVSSIIFIFFRQMVITASENNQENIWFVLFVIAVTIVALWYTFTKKITQLD